MALNLTLTAKLGCEPRLTPSLNVTRQVPEKLTVAALYERRAFASYPISAVTDRRYSRSVLAQGVFQQRA